MEGEEGALSPPLIDATAVAVTVDGGGTVDGAVVGGEGDAEHPLPPEIAAMPRDETVCRFCGVSYLIHREIKALEKTAKELRDKLTHYEGYDAREADYIRRRDEDARKLADVEAQLTEARAKCEGLDELLLGANERAVTFQRLLERDKEDLASLRQSAVDAQAELESLRLQVGSLAADKAALQNECARAREEVDAGKKRAEEAVRELEGAKGRLGELRKEREASAAQLATTTDELQTLRAELAAVTRRANDAADALSQQRLRCDELTREAELVSARRAQTDGAVAELERTVAALRSELQSARVTDESKSDELARLRTEAERLRADGVRMAETAAAVEAELLSLRSEREVLRASTSKSMQDASREIRALRDEREAMITAHQAQIQQLQESFLDRIRAAELRLPEEIAAMEAKFAYDLNKCVTDYETRLSALATRAAEEKSALERARDTAAAEATRAGEELLRQATSRLRAEWEEDARRRDAANEQRLEAARNEARTAAEFTKGDMTRLCQENEYLRKVVSELEQRARDAQHTANEASRRAAEQVEAIATQLTSRDTKINILEETVRNQCEEREELLEALREGRAPAIHPLDKPTAEQLAKMKEAEQGGGSGRSTPRKLLGLLRGDSGKGKARPAVEETVVVEDPQDKEWRKMRKQGPPRGKRTAKVAPM